MTEAPPVSVKAALRCGDRWVLLRNDRGEWELPGGRVDPTDPTLVDVVRRECREELGLEVTVGRLIDSWLFEVVPGRRVVIVCFEAHSADDARPVISEEHTSVGLFAVDELARIPLPVDYANAIRTAARAG